MVPKDPARGGLGLRTGVLGTVLVCLCVLASACPLPHMATDGQATPSPTQPGARSPLVCAPSKLSGLTSLESGDLPV